MMCPDGELIAYENPDTRTVLQALRRGQRLSKDGPLLGTYDPQSGAYKWTTYSAVIERARRIAAGLWHTAKMSDSTLASCEAPRCIGCWSQNRAEVRSQ